MSTLAERPRVPMIFEIRAERAYPEVNGGWDAGSAVNYPDVSSIDTQFSRGNDTTPRFFHALTAA